MKLIRCYVQNFGKLHNFEYDFKDNLNIIKAENGFGKTTLACFIKSMFYGLDASKSEKSERKKYKPWQGGIFGGNIEFEVNNKKYRIERFFGNKISDDTFKLFDLSTNLESFDYTENIGEEIFKINKAGYERSTYIPQGEIQIEMEDSLNAKLGNILENDNDINSSDEALTKITEMMKLYVKTGNKGLLNEKKIILSKMEREQENNKFDYINLENKNNKYNQLKEKIREKINEKEKMEELLSKKIEYDRKKAKQETYNNILYKVNEEEKRYNEIMEFFKEGIPEEEKLQELNSKVWEIEKCKLEIENNTLSDEEEQKYEELKEKFEGNKITEKKIDTQIEKCMRFKIIKSVIKYAFILAIIILGIILIIANISKIMGITVTILGIVILIFAILKKDKKTNDKISTLTNLRTEINQYKSIEEKKKEKENLRKRIIQKKEITENEITEYLNKYFDENSSSFSDLIQQLKVNKNELMIANRELEKAKKQKENYENTNNIEEIITDENQENAKINEEELKNKIEKTKNNIEEIIDEKNQIKNQIEILESKIDDNEYLENDIENLKKEIEKIENKYSILEKTKNLLENAKTSFSTNYLKEMINGFNEYLKMIDDNVIDTNLDINLDVKIDVNGSKKEIKYFSAGYKDLIYICVRFILIKALFKEELPFVILDDPFVNLDDEKTKKAIELINNFSKQYQIIYFSCNESRI